MHRIARTDTVLDALYDEREQLAIEASLLANAEMPEPARLAGMRDRLALLDRRISNYRPLAPDAPLWERPSPADDR